MLKVLRIISFCLLPLASIAGGFELNFHGIRQQGMGNSGAATLLGSSSVFYNPGAIVFLRNKFDFQAGSSLASYNAAFYEPISGIFARTTDQFIPIYNAYGSYKITDYLAIGFGVYSPFGGKLEWEENWRGRFLVQSIGLKIVNYQPTMALKLTSNVSFGIGLQYSTAGFNFSKDIPISSSDGSRSYVNLSAKTSQFGVNAGVFIQASEKLDLSFSAKSEMKYNFIDGAVHVVVPEGASGFFTPNNLFSTNISTPNCYVLGVAFHPNRRLLFTADLQYQEWSQVKSTQIEFDNQQGALKNSEIDRHFKDAPAIRIGAQYTYRSYLSVRAGAGFERSPINRNFLYPDLPDTDKYTFTVGLTYEFNDHFALDFAGNLIEGQQTNANYSPYNFNGVYKSRLLVGSVGMTYIF